MSDSISLLELLRAGTRDAHARIETVPVLARLLDPDLRRDEYVCVLQHLHAFHSYAEPAAAAELVGWPEAAAMLDGARPRALADDLAWFGASTVQPPPLPVLDGPAAALGMLYVIEGSGLGGRVIAKHVTSSIGIAEGAGGSFFCRQDADTARRRWRLLTGLLEQPAAAIGIDAMAGDRVVQGARESFRYLELWLRKVEIAAGSAHASVMAETAAT